MSANAKSWLAKAPVSPPGILTDGIRIGDTKRIKEDSQRERKNDRTGFEVTIE